MPPEEDQGQIAQAFKKLRIRELEGLDEPVA
jgi:hypothetical protein